MPYYLTLKRKPQHKQLTFDEICFGDVDLRELYKPNNDNNTITYKLDYIPQHYIEAADIPELIHKLKVFNNVTEECRKVPRKELYHHFRIPKNTKDKYGHIKWRDIDAPLEPLMSHLRMLNTMLQNEFYCLHHTAAFGYVKDRSIYKALKRHQKNESNWFAKFDLKNFFGSTTLDFTMHSLSMVFPFCEIVKSSEGKNELRKALELGFLDGKLPQGSASSPYLTNLIMVPFDFEFSKRLREMDQRYVYTRYADDLQISSRYEFDEKKITKEIDAVLYKLDAPFRINAEKTRYGSKAGRNWNLGLMLNAQNEITVGHKKKRWLKVQLFNYAMDKTNGIKWDYSELSTLNGHLNYCLSIEKRTITALVKSVSEKCGLDIAQSIKDDLRKPKDL